MTDKCCSDPLVSTPISVDFAEDISSVEWESFLKTIQSLLLPEQVYGEDRPSTEDDFTNFKKDVEFGLHSVFKFIQQFSSTANKNQPFPHDSLVWTVILCSEHSAPNPWTTEETRILACACIKTLCVVQGCSSTSQLLQQSVKTSGSIFKQALLLLRPKLLKSSWRKYPGAVSGYKWLLLQVPSPHLAEYLDLVSPTALIIIDDHDTERRLTGLHCLSHIINHVPRTEICQRGLHLVFYKILEPILWQRTASLVEPAMSCLTTLLILTQRGYTRSVEPGMWDLFDETLSALINKMVIEDQIPLRKAYIKSLGPLLSAMGPSVIRWSKPLSTVFDEYLRRESFDTRIYALQALKIFTQLSAPRIPENGDFFLYLLLRTSYDLSLSEAPDTTGNDVVLIKECLQLIQEAAPQEFSNIKEELLETESNMFMKSVLSEFMISK